MADSPTSFSTLCVRNRHEAKGPVHPHREAIYPTSAFSYPDTAAAMALFEDREKGYVYGRWANPTCDAAAAAIADLECAGASGVLREQVGATLFASGMAAIASALLACASPGERILVQQQLYGGTDELFRRWLEPRGIGRITADLNDPAALSKALAQNPVAVYTETPSNPMLACVDLPALASALRAHAGDGTSIPLLVDNTFATPWAQRPLQLGADVVLHSTTKFLNGHGSALGGCVVAKDRDWLRGPLFDQLKLLGAVPSPFDAWLLLNGIKTLDVRMQRQCANAQALAEWLDRHPAVQAVHYLGLETHPFHELAARQMHGFGAMLSFELKGELEAGIQLMDRVELCTLATTLGTVDTLIQHPASMTHAPVPKAEREASGISDGLVRLSVGLEALEDLQEDLDRGLA
jgi:methionine-gamma-lyase